VAREADPRRHAAFFHGQGLQTPCLLIDLEMVAARLCELAEAMRAAGIYYAVKAHPIRRCSTFLAGWARRSRLLPPLNSICAWPGACRSPTSPLTHSRTPSPNGAVTK